MYEALLEACRRKDGRVHPSGFFDRRTRGHMEAMQGGGGLGGLAGGRPIMPPMAGGMLEAILQQPSTTRRVMYLHVPFCKRICTFCGFFRKPSESADMSGFVVSLLKQIERYSQTRWVQEGLPFEAVYVGGGTPTALASEELALVIRKIKAFYPLNRKCEITVETRFEGVDRAYLQRLYEAGVTRLSFGVQSFDTHLRRGVGRIGDRQQVLDTLHVAGSIGFENLSVDLIYNLPGQTLENWQTDMDDLCTVPVTGASIYALIPMRGSAMVRQIELGQQPPLGDVRHEYELYAAAYDRLSARQGWRLFSFQHFGRHGRETNIYNGVRAGGVDTLGMGSGAGGILGSFSYMNAMNFVKYGQDQAAGRDENIMAFTSGGKERRYSGLYHLVEGCGLSRVQMEHEFAAFMPAIEALLQSGLLEERDGKFVLTREGGFWGYNITQLMTEMIASMAATGDPTEKVIKPVMSHRGPPTGMSGGHEKSAGHPVSVGMSQMKEIQRS